LVLDVGEWHFWVGRKNGRRELDLALDVEPIDICERRSVQASDERSQASLISRH
jgi:hypothetical protein